MANEERAGQAGAEEDRAGQGGAVEGRAGQVGVVEERAGEVGGAVPVEAAGGASGLFSTAQQRGGAAGVALLGTVFFGWVTSRHAFAAATTHTGPYAVGAFTLCALLSLLLPRTAVSDAALIGTDQLNRFPRRLSRGAGVHVDAGPRRRWRWGRRSGAYRRTEGAALPGLPHLLLVPMPVYNLLSLTAMQQPVIEGRRDVRQRGAR